MARRYGAVVYPVCRYRRSSPGYGLALMFYMNLSIGSGASFVQLCRALTSANQSLFCRERCSKWTIAFP
jgi:hypothetical protein